MTKARQKQRKEARRKGLTKQKIPRNSPIPEPTEEELAEMRGAAKQPDLFEPQLLKL